MEDKENNIQVQKKTMIRSKEKEKRMTKKLKQKKEKTTMGKKINTEGKEEDGKDYKKKEREIKQIEE